MKIAQECGQRWYRWRSWRVGSIFRIFPAGFAVGPIMFIMFERKEGRWQDYSA